MPTADAPGSHPPVHIASAGAFTNFSQAFFGPVFRNLAKIGIRDVARRWRKRSKCLNWHKINTFPKSATWRAKPLIPLPDGSQLSVPQLCCPYLVQVKRNEQYIKGNPERNRFFEK